MEIIIGVICIAFVVLVVFLIIVLLKLRKTLQNIDRALHEARHILNAMKEPSLALINHMNKLTADITKKSEGLDLLFRPLYAMKKERIEHPSHEKLPQIIAFMVEGIRLFNKIKNEIK